MDRQTLSPGQPRFAPDFPDFYAIRVNQIDRFFIVLQTPIALSLANVKTFLSAPKGINDRPVGYSPRPTVDAVESVLNSESFDESEMLSFDGLYEFLVSILMNKYCASSEQELFLHFVANPLRVLHRCALVTGHNQASKLVRSSLQSFVQCSRELCR